MGGLPGAADDLANAAHGLRVGGDHANCPEVMKDIFGGNRFAANARFGKGDILSDARVKVMANHEHIEVLIKGIEGVGAGWVRRRGQHRGIAADPQNIRCMTTARPFGVVGVNGAVFEGGNGSFDKARFVEGIGVDSNGNVVLVGNAEAGINRSGGSAPVFVKLEANGAGLDLLN